MRYVSADFVPNENTYHLGAKASRPQNRHFCSSIAEVPLNCRDFERCYDANLLLSE